MAMMTMMIDLKPAKARQGRNRCFAPGLKIVFLLRPAFPELIGPCSP
jgi:hypothetical protein